MVSVCTWDEAQEKLHLALAGYFDEAKAEVAAGREAVFRVGTDSFACIRFEQFTDTNEIEMVVVGFAGDVSCTDALFEYGRSRNCHSVRMHTYRTGLQWVLNRMGMPFFLDGKDEDDRLVIRAIYGR